MFKIITPLILVSSLFAIDNNELNKYFNDNKININCVKNECIGKKISYNSISIEHIDFKIDNELKFEPIKDYTKFKNYCMKQINNELKCNVIVNEMIFTNLITNVILEKSINIKNAKFNTLTFDNLSSNNKLPLFDFFQHKKELNNLKLSDITNNRIDFNVKNLISDFNDIEYYLTYIDETLQMLNEIPKNEWNNEIANDVEYYLSLRVIINKYNEYAKNKTLSKDLSIKINPLEENNILFYNVNLKIKDPLKTYDMFFKLSLKNINGISKNFDKLDNKEIALALLLPSFNIDEFDVKINNEGLNKLHKEFLLNDSKYKEAINSLLKNSNLENENLDEMTKKINLFLNQFLSFKYNNHNINIKNLDNKELIILLNNYLDDREINLDNFLNSLKINIKNFNIN